jgi:hypothetical protein
MLVGGHAKVGLVEGIHDSHLAEQSQQQRTSNRSFYEGVNCQKLCDVLGDFGNRILDHVARKGEANATQWVLGSGFTWFSRAMRHGRQKAVFCVKNEVPEERTLKKIEKESFVRCPRTRATNTIFWSRQARYTSYVVPFYWKGYLHNVFLNFFHHEETGAAGIGLSHGRSDG